AVGQWPVMQPLPCRVQADGVVVAFADVQPQEHAITAGHPPRPSFVAGGRRSSIDGRHPRYDETYPKAAVSLFSGPSMPPGPATPPPPRIMDSTGGISHTEPGDHSSLIRNHEKGNGGRARR